MKRKPTWLLAIRTRILVVLVLVVGLAGCATLVAPKSFDQQAAYVVAGITAARQTAADYLVRGRITVAQAERIQRDADAARQHLDAARAFYAGGQPEDAQSALAFAARLLTQIEAALKGAQP